MTYFTATHSTQPINVAFCTYGYTIGNHDGQYRQILTSVYVGNPIMVNDPANTTIGSLNLSFGRLGADTTTPYPRRVSYKGRVYSSDTLLCDLLEPGQTKIIFHFVWNDAPEFNPTIDRTRIDEYFEDLEIEMEQEKFIHENETYNQYLIDESRIDKYFEDLEIEMEQEKFIYENDLFDHFATYTEEELTQYRLENEHREIEATKKLSHKTLPPQYPNQNQDQNTHTPAFSLCIPRLFLNITENRIRAIFRNLGFPSINAIDIVLCEGKNKDGAFQNYNRAFVHFDSMIIEKQTPNVYQSIQKILSGEKIKIIYDDPWFWIVNISNSVRPRFHRNPPKIVL